MPAPVVGWALRYGSTRRLEGGRTVPDRQRDHPAALRLTEVVSGAEAGLRLDEVDQRSRAAAIVGLEPRRRVEDREPGSGVGSARDALELFDDPGRAGEPDLCERSGLRQPRAKCDGAFVRVDFECDDELFGLLQASVDAVPPPRGAIAGQGFKRSRPLVGIRYVDA
jgi:hypothetical protein